MTKYFASHGFDSKILTPKIFIKWCLYNNLFVIFVHHIAVGCRKYFVLMWQIWTELKWIAFFNVVNIQSELEVSKLREDKQLFRDEQWDLTIYPLIFWVTLMPNAQNQMWALETYCLFQKHAQNHALTTDADQWWDSQIRHFSLYRNPWLRNDPELNRQLKLRLTQHDHPVLCWSL